MAVTEPDERYERLLATATGGMVPSGVQPFAGSERLRPDGRPRPELRTHLRRIPDARNAVTVLSILLYPVIIIAGYVQLAQRVPWAGVWGFPAAFILMGTAFPRFSILNHEAAHRLLFSNRTMNDLIGEKLFGLIPFGDGSDRYRRSHSNHHRDEFGPKEPDFNLYARYPIERASLRRKLLRDATGQSGFKILKPVFVGLTKPGRRVRAMKTIGAQLVIFALFWLAGHPWLYPTLWFLPWFTYWRVVNRLRALAEHAGMTRSPDRRLTTHHVRQGPVSSFLFAPYNTGYHLAHHVDSGIPFRALPVLHQVLIEDGYVPDGYAYPNYRSFWRELTRPEPS